MSEEWIEDAVRGLLDRVTELEEKVSALEGDLRHLTGNGMDE